MGALSTLVDCSQGISADSERLFDGWVVAQLSRAGQVRGEPWTMNIWVAGVSDMTFVVMIFFLPRAHDPFDYNANPESIEVCG